VRSHRPIDCLVVSPDGTTQLVIVASATGWGQASRRVGDEVVLFDDLIAEAGEVGEGKEATEEAAERDDEEGVGAVRTPGR
jgi:hypothetical protein